MDKNLLEESSLVLSEAECLFNEQQIEVAIDSMANQITQKLSTKNPLLLPVMIGGVLLAGKLIAKLQFPCQIDYIHATRYRSGISGHELHWKKRPDKEIANQTILLIDDILDEGITLAAIKEDCIKTGASEVYTAVLADKEINKPRPIANADFTGLKVPDRYVFGYGMDYKEFHRNVNGIYAVKSL